MSASRSTLVACMRSAMNRCSSGEIVRSRRETAYQACRDRQAATIVRSPKRESDTRPCTAYSTRARPGSTPLAKSFRNASWVRAPNPSA